jgi:hypothetical protein
MLIWIGNILTIPIYAFALRFTGLGKKQQSSVLLFLMFCQLLFLTAFKDNAIFHDIWAYLIGFNYSKTIEWNNIYKISNAFGYLNYELGWRYFVKTLSSLSNDEGLLIFATGFIIIYSYLLVIKKHSNIPWLSIFLFITLVFYNSLFVLRQNLAVALSLFSLPFIIERKLLKFLLVIGLAFLFHKTAIIFIILYFLYPSKLNMKTFFMLLIGGFLFYSGIAVLIDYGITYFPKYEIYRYSDNTANFTPFLISVSVFLFICTQYYPFRKVIEYEKLFFIMVIMVTLFDFSRIGLEFSMIARLSAYFFPATIILLPNAINNVKTPMLKYMSISTIIALYFAMMINQMNYGFELAF